MTTISYLRRLYDHMYWTDGQVLDRLRTAPNERGVQLFAHTLAAEQVWLARLLEQDTSQMAIWPELTIQKCQDLVQQTREGYRSYLADLSETELEEVVEYRNSKGVAFHTPRIDILTQVALHGSYHRGQIAQVLRGAGVDPVNTDYITWVRQQEVA